MKLNAKNWFLPCFLLSLLTLSYVFYVFEYCYNNLIKKGKYFEKAILYLYFYNLIFFLVIWSLFFILIKKQPTIPDKYKLPSQLRRKLFLQNHNESYVQAKISNQASSESFRIVRLSEHQNEIIETHIKKINLDIKTRNSINQVNVCFICKIIKPDRCYHCKKCSRCILKRDHHCPWFNTCIGFVNHKDFILFLIYFTILLAYSILTTFHFFSSNFVCLIRKINGCNILVVSYFILNLIFLIFLIMFTLNALYLASINATSIEFKYPPRLFKNSNRTNKISPFSLDDKIANLAQIFGYNMLTAFIPLSTNSCSNGCSWKVDL